MAEEGAAGAAGAQDSKRVPRCCSATTSLLTLGACWSPLRLIWRHPHRASWATRLTFCPRHRRWQHYGSANGCRRFHQLEVSYGSFAAFVDVAAAAIRKDCRLSGSISSNAPHSFHTSETTCQRHATHSWQACPCQDLDSCAVKLPARLKK